MRLLRLSLQNVRNIPAASLTFHHRRQFFLGRNGQGKTNLLEAIGFITALRSFRTSDARLLIREGSREAAMAYDVEHETLGETRVVIRLRGDAKEVTVDQARVARLADYLGKFPTVVFSSQDIQMIRGSPAIRRRWLDLTLAAMDAEYVRALQDYHRALVGRNALLKRNASGAELAAFERPLAKHGARLVAARAEGLRSVGEGVVTAYTRVTGHERGEVPALHYLPNLPDATEVRLLEKLESGRARDLQMKSTLSGPHRDDFDFLLDGRPARDFGSEGQQRALVLALRAAQAHVFQQRSGIAPVILADDVLGELDGERRLRFWSALNPAWQILATGTARPSGADEEWEIFEVAQGSFTPSEAAKR